MRALRRSWQTFAFPYRIVSYDARGVQIGECLDNEPDGRVEKCTTLLKGAETAEWIDDDQDGLYDRAVVLDQHGKPTITYSDEDDDGLLEEMKCQEIDGTKWQFDIRSCTVKKLPSAPAF